jgi:protein-disulfide isomerase-like protein with CxxC motif
VEGEETAMEATLFEDPACCWCWAFQPVATVFAFELGTLVRIRHVMGGLRDRPVADAGFIMQQWKKAEAVSGMPFDGEVWRLPPLRTTFLACRSIKAAAMFDQQAAARLLRKLQEAFCVERVLIDDIEAIFSLARQVGCDVEAMAENLASGRAEALFARDRAEAAQHGFGFPTLILRSGNQDSPIVLQGAVPYADILQALSSLGFPVKDRPRFRDTAECWARLFRIHRRLTFAEIHEVTGLDRQTFAARARDIGIRQSGVFHEIERLADGREREASQPQAPAASPAPAAPPEPVAPREPACPSLSVAEPAPVDGEAALPAAGAPSERDEAPLEASPE